LIRSSHHQIEEESSVILPEKSVETFSATKSTGLAAYHKCIKDLVKFGFIKSPSFNPTISSQPSRFAPISY